MSSKAALALFLFAITSFSFSFSQETCDDCIDNDGDGLIDCYDSDCYTSALCDSFFIKKQPTDTFCRYYPSSGLIKLKKLWQTSTQVDSRNTTIVGDIDKDGVAEVISHNSIDSNQLYVFNGLTGQLKSTIITPLISGLNDGVAIGDLDRDGFSEIFIVNDDDFLRCYDYAGNFLWRSSSKVSGTSIGSGVLRPNLANFNGDDTVEVYAGNAIFNASTGRLIAFGTGSFGSLNKPDAHPAAADVLPYHSVTCAECSGLELICGNQVYGVDIPNNRMLLRATAPAGLKDGFTSIADMDGDDSLDVIVNMGNCSVYAWNPRKETQIGTTFLYPGNGLGGHPNVGNYDNDPQLEIGIAGSSEYLLIDNDTLKWKYPIKDVSSHRTGSSAFDFNCDNILEIVYRSEDSLYIFDGATGEKLTAEQCGSATRTELPVVVDVDGDGEANIVCSCNSFVVAWQSATNTWPSARKVWNQHNYFNVNVNDDLTIPCIQQNNANDSLPKRLNSYLNQMPLMDESGKSVCYSVLSDFVISIDSVVVENCLDSALIKFTICNNAGDSIIFSGLPVAFYNEKPNDGGVLIDTFITDKPIFPNRCESFYHYVLGGNFNIVAFVKDLGDLISTYPHLKFNECDSANNSANKQLCNDNKDILIPNIITANADGINDFFIVKNLQQGSKLDIYNRWGIKVFEDNNYQNNWSGIATNGTKVIDGVYYYVLRLPEEPANYGFITVVGSR